MDDVTAARTVIEEYVAACTARSVERLRAIFHQEARMSGYLMGQCLVGSPQPFYDAVAGAPAETGAYRAQITDVAVTGQVASVTLEEQGFLGLSFTDYFHLVRIDGRWWIVSKTFTTR